ncbi:MAG: OmpA family protein [Alphaproteobacteria bacterium]
MSSKFVKACLGILMFLSAPSFASGLDDDRLAGKDFLDHLAREYRSCGNAEARERDMKDARYFRNLAAKAEKGQMVLPAAVSSRIIPSDYLSELNTAKEKLDYHLGLGARDNTPAAAAAAQASYECWLQEAEENKLDGDIDKEKAKFYANLSALTSPLTTTVIYFPVDSATLTSSARSKLNAMVRQMKANGIRDVAMGTYASSTASYTHNLALTKFRADAVKNYLRARGIREASVILRTYGEGDLAVPTGNNRENKLNRRAVLSLVKKRP